MIKIHTNTPIEDRKEFADMLMRLVNVAVRDDAEVYMPQAGDTSRWSIDPNGNDFWVKFCEENPKNFTISCRYTNQSARLLLVALTLVQRYDYSVI